MSLLLLVTTSISAQKFNFTYNGTTITYEIISVTKHEVKVDYVPENVTVVTVPSVVFFNGENFRVTTIGRGGSRDGGWFGGYEGEGYYSFNNCKLLKQVVLPNTIKVIGYGAFRGCTWLRSINMPSGLEVIGGEAFEDCESLTSITIPSSVKEVGEFAFNRCKCVINIPATIDTINQSAFYGCKFRLSEKLGYVWNDTIVLNTGDDSIKMYDNLFKWGKKIIYKNAFGSKYTIIDFITFNNKVISSPKYYLSSSVGNPIASNIKKSLIEAEMYDLVLSFYPKDTELQKLQRNAEIRRLVNQASEESKNGNYIDAKNLYERALALDPNDNSIKKEILKTEDDIAEQKRLLVEAEEISLRKTEETQVRINVDQKASLAREMISKGRLQMAIDLLQEAIHITDIHNFDYRKTELVQRIDSLHQVQTQIADKSKVFDYKKFRPDLYEATNNAISLKIKSYITDIDKPLCNNITFTMNTGNQPASFQLSKPYKPLKRFCGEVLATERLQPLVIDGHPLDASATFNYDIEYAKGTVNVQQSNGRLMVNPKFKMSTQLESDLTNMFNSKLNTFSSACDGKYKFKVTSMDVGGQMDHKIELIRVHTNNGPQNAWRSLIVPGWGDKYVDGEFKKMKMLMSYGLIALGIPCLFAKDKIQVTYTGDHYDYETDRYVNEYDTTYSNPTRIIGVIAVSCGAAIWVADVVHVFVKGRRNKKENKERLGRLSFAYDPKHDRPELVYTLRF